MQTSRFVAVVGTLAALVGVAALTALYLAGSAIGGFGGDEDPEPPQVQRDVLAVVREGQQAASGANDVQLVQARLDRDRALCSVLRPVDLEVAGWWGTVRDIETGLVGDAARLVVELEDDVELVGADDASIEPGTDLYEAVAGLDDGDEVRVDGRLVADPEGCLAEESLRIGNSLRTPDFQLELEAIERR